MNWAIIVFAGFMGTSFMTLFLSIVHRAEIANGDMVRAIGSVFTRSEKNALGVGLTLHYIAGIFFAFLYALVVSAAPISIQRGIVIVCTATGFFHGLGMSMLLAVAVAENHPIERFREAGLDVVITHLIAHVIYGFTVGLILAIFNFDLHFVFER